MCLLKNDLKPETQQSKPNNIYKKNTLKYFRNIGLQFGMLKKHIKTKYILSKRKTKQRNNSANW